MTKKELIDCIENGLFEDGRKIRIGYCWTDGTDISPDRWLSLMEKDRKHIIETSPQKTAWIFAGYDFDYDAQWTLIAVADRDDHGAWKDWNFNPCNDMAFCEARDAAEEME